MSTVRPYTGAMILPSASPKRPDKHGCKAPRGHQCTVSARESGGGAGFRKLSLSADAGPSICQ